MTTANEIVTIVFATSGAGKTTFINEESKALIRKHTGYTAQQFQRKFGYPAIIDGDELIAETIGWPEGEWWDTLPIDEYEDFVKNVLDTVSAAAKRSFVVFGVFPVNQDHLNVLLSNLNIGNIEYLWVNEYLLQRNMESRKMKLPPGSAKPTDAQRSLRSQQHAFELWSNHLGKSMVRQWDALPKLFVEYLELFKHGVRAIQVVQDSVLVDGLLKGGLIRVRYKDDKLEMVIAYASDELPLSPENAVEILPYQSGIWMRFSDRFASARRTLGSRFK